MKTPENLSFSGAFRWNKMGILVRNGLSDAIPTLKKRIAYKRRAKQVTELE